MSASSHRGFAADHQATAGVTLCTLAALPWRHTHHRWLFDTVVKRTKSVLGGIVWQGSGLH